MIPQQRIKTWKVHPSMRGAWAFEFYKHMTENKDIYLLCGDLGFPMFNAHREDFPDRFLNTGASEQSLLDIAVGLAYAGKVPVCYSITPFLLWRAAETIRTYIAYENLNVKLIGSGRDSQYKHDGWSHNASDAKTLLNMFDNVAQYWPEDLKAVEILTKEMLQCDKPSFMSLSK